MAACECGSSDCFPFRIDEPIRSEPVPGARGGLWGQSPMRATVVVSSPGFGRSASYCIEVYTFPGCEDPVSVVVTQHHEGTESETLADALRVNEERSTSDYGCDCPQEAANWLALNDTILEMVRVNRGH